MIIKNNSDGMKGFRLTQDAMRMLEPQGEVAEGIDVMSLVEDVPWKTGILEEMRVITYEDVSGMRNTFRAQGVTDGDGEENKKDEEEGNGG